MDLMRTTFISSKVTRNPTTGKVTLEAVSGNPVSYTHLGETTSALGLMGLAMAALGFVGLKRKREDVYKRQAKAKRF